MDTKPGYIKLPRGLLDMPLSRKPQQLALFVHLLLRANREPKVWNGIRIERGQVVASIRSLSTACGLSLWQVRSSLDNLKRDGLTHETTHGPARRQGEQTAHDPARGFTIITICEFDSYEGQPAEDRTRNRTRETAEATHETAHNPTTPREDIDILLSIIEDPRFLDIVRDWIEYKRERKQAYKGRKGLSQFYNRLKELSNGDPDTARRIVAEAMAANYATIYPLKASRPAGPNQATRSRVEVPEYDSNNFKSTF